MPHLTIGNFVVMGAVLVCAVAAFAACMYMSYRDRKANNQSSRR